MGRYLTRRILHTLLVIFGVSLVAFLLVHLSGDPAALLVSPDATQADVERIRRIYGLDRPLYVQYGKFVFRLIQGDMGQSFRTGHDNWELIATRFPATLHLTIASLLLALSMAIPVGVLSALRRGSVIDAVARGAIIIAQSAPVFWTAIMLVLLFALRWAWFPPSGYESRRALILPAFALGIHSAAELARLTRNSVLDVLGEDYVRTARSKGLQEIIVITRHVLRNALIPVITLLGLRFGVLMGGAVITETIFDWPGLGNLAVQAVLNRDVPLVQACLMTTAFFITFSSLIVDLMYSLLDPRIKYQ